MTDHAPIGAQVLRTEVNDGNYQDTIPVGTPGVIIAWDEAFWDVGPYQIKWDHANNEDDLWYTSEEFALVDWEDEG